MSEERSEREIAAERLAEDMMNVTIHLYPRYRDVQVGHNPFGYNESLYVWFRYVFVPLPSTVMRSVLNILRFIGGLGATFAASVLGILLALGQVFVVVPIQTLLALFGALRVRYTEETVRECFLQSISQLESYRAFIEAGGKFDPKIIVLTPGFMQRVEEVIKRSEQRDE